MHIVLDDTPWPKREDDNRPDTYTALLYSMIEGCVLEGWLEAIDSEAGFGYILW